MSAQLHTPMQGGEEELTGLTVAGPASIARTLNQVVSKAIRWCTPSIDNTFPRLDDPYASDTSTSFESLGFPSDPTGMFKEACDRASAAYGADRTLFSVGGTTGSNFVVLRALSRQFEDLRVLSTRNVHRSIITAAEDYGIDLCFLSANIDRDHQLYLPNTSEEICRGLVVERPHVLLLVSPTYEGLTPDLRRIISDARSVCPDLLIFVDEAWGAHLHFSDRLPVDAMAAGADICVQSTHKQGGSLQQSGMIHWSEIRVDGELLVESYRSLGTSSPSYLLLSSLDAARETMERSGRDKIDHVLGIAERLRIGVDDIPGLRVVSLAQLRARHPVVYDKDETKVVIDVSGTGFTGYEVASALDRDYQIVVESYSILTIVLLVPFRASSSDVRTTLAALTECSRRCSNRSEGVVFPPTPEEPPRRLGLREIVRLREAHIERVQLDDAVGRIAAETITPFPPGIPLTLKGEELTAHAVEYYQALRRHPNVHVAARDKTLASVWVVR